MNTQTTQTNPYYAPRSDDDVDLIEIIRDMLIQSGLKNNVLECFDKHQLVANSRSKIPNIQRFNMNRYWAIQLMSVDACSEQERFCLISNGNIEDWISLFQQKILPFLIEHNLPRNI